MPSINDVLAHAAINHQIDLQRYSNHVVRKIIALLNRTDAHLFAAITNALENMPTGPFQVDRLEALLAQVRMLNARAYQQAELELTAELRAMAEYEIGYQYALFVHTLPAGITINMIGTDVVYAAAMARPFQGRLLREWAAGMEAGRMARIRDALRIGFIEGQTIDQMVRMLRGTRAKKYEDGIIEIDRRNAQTIVRTATSHMAGVVRNNFYGGNDDIIKAVAWLSTLDNRTSSQCRIRDGLEYTNTDEHKPIGHAIPWLAGPGNLHFNCRSVSTPVTKSWEELGIDLPEMPPGERASMDGTVPADMVYSQWIMQQSAARQDEILGSTRGKLLREGGLDLGAFYSDKGKYFTLDELRLRDAAAFKKAGL